MLFEGATFARSVSHRCDDVRWLEHHPVQGQSAGIELEQRVTWGCGGRGEREQTEGLYLCSWVVALLYQIYKMLTLSRIMSKWYPNKSHSWRNRLNASMDRSLDFHLKVTSSSSHQNSCRWQHHPGPCWCHFPGCPCPSGLTLLPAVLWKSTLLCRAQGLQKSQKPMNSLISAMQKSLDCSILTDSD